MAELFSFAMPAKTKYLSQARAWFRATLDLSRLDEKCRDTLTLALCEALENQIKHHHKRDDGRRATFDVEVKRTAFVITIHDFCHAEAVPRIKPRKLSEIRPGGLGTYFIRKSVDKVEYVREGDGVMALRLTKYVR